MAFKTLEQCYIIQDVVYNAITSCSDNKELAALTRAWTDCVERQRILRGKPLPGSERPEPKPSPLRRRPRARIIGPVPDTSCAAPDHVPPVPTESDAQPFGPPAPDQP